MNYDILIVGSGFSGTTCALILAKRGLRVCVVDAGVHPRFAIGESTAPHATMLMRIIATRYGVPELFDIADQRLLHTRVSSKCGVKRNFGFVHLDVEAPQATPNFSQSVFPTLPYGTEHHYFRQDIDSYLLWKAVECGAEVLQQTRIEDVSIEDEGVQAKLADGRILKSRFIIDASGLGSLLGGLLKLKDPEPRTRLATRSLFTHMVGVRHLEEVLAEAKLPRGVSPWSQGTLHHIFRGGWMWVIPFDNHAQSQSRLCSVGLNLECKLHGEAPSAQPGEEFRAFVARFPLLTAQFRDARPARPWNATGRIQFTSQRTVGRRYALMSHAAGFIDPLFSRGLVNTFDFINVLMKPLLDALLHGDGALEDPEQLDAHQQALVLGNARTVESAYDAFDTFDSWKAWYQTWALGSMLGGMRFNRKLSWHRDLKDASILCSKHDATYPGELCPEDGEFVRFAHEVRDALHRARHEGGRSRAVLAHVEQRIADNPFWRAILASGLFYPEVTDAHEVGRLDLRPLFSIVRAGRRTSDAQLAERYLDFPKRHAALESLRYVTWSAVNAGGRL